MKFITDCLKKIFHKDRESEQLPFVQSIPLAFRQADAVLLRAQKVRLLAILLFGVVYGIVFDYSHELTKKLGYEPCYGIGIGLATSFLYEVLCLGVQGHPAGPGGRDVLARLESRQKKARYVEGASVALILLSAMISLILGLLTKEVRATSAIGTIAGATSLARGISFLWPKPVILTESYNPDVGETPDTPPLRAAARGPGADGYWPNL